MTNTFEATPLFNVINHCRLCKHAGLTKVLDFGLSPLANSYPIKNSDFEHYFPLTVMKCDGCGHVQLRETVRPEILFAEYSYASSDSPALIKHFNEFARTVVGKLNLGEYDSILEIGSNDGILLKEFVSLGILSLYGVEPATNMAERSMGKGAVIINDFFNEDTAKKIAEQHGKMSVVCANNVFAHVADVHGMLAGVTKVLANDGVFVFENAYLLDTISGLYFDQVYHEHLQYYGIVPLMKFLDSYGLEIFDIQRVTTQGGSFRIFAQYKSGTRKVEKTVQEWIDREVDAKLYDTNTYKDFAGKIETIASQVRGYVAAAKANGHSISCYGCPAKFALFSKIFGLTVQNIDYVIDDSPLKQGRLSPGKKIPIRSRQHFLDNPTDICIVAVWNMADAVIARNPEFKGQWVRVLPEFKVSK